MRSWAAGAAVYFTSCLFFSLPTGAPIGGGYLDPVGKIGAQDESVYSHIAIRMAERGGWPTPVFMDRYFLYKPPLLYWLSGLSARILGISPHSLRLPSVLAAAGVCLLVFLWTRSVVAVVLLATSPLFANLAARNLTDAPLCFLITLAMWLVYRDQRLQSWSTIAGIGAASGCAILMKSTAGLIPLAILAAFWTLSRERAAFWKLAAIGGVALCVAAPWFIYQYLTHQRWFWGEFVQVELLAYGRSAPPQTTGEGTLAFYASRLIWAAPVLLIGLIAAAAASRRRWREFQLPLLWLGTLLLALAGYQYRNATYLLLFLPAMAIIASTRFPVFALLGAAWFLLAPKVHPGNAIPELLRERCESGRTNELIVAADDQFHAAVLPFRKVRYAFPGEAQPPPGFSLDFRKMGITVTVDEFLDLDKYGEKFVDEMRAWGLEDYSAIATVIALTKPGDLERLMKARPDADYLVRGTIVKTAYVPVSPPARSCAM